MDLHQFGAYTDRAHIESVWAPAIFEDRQALWLSKGLSLVI
jgi:hypothetical protein